MTNRLYILYIYTLLLLGAAPPTFAQTIKGNVYGGGQLGKVAGNTSVTIESGTIETGASGGSNIFGGGYQAEVAGNTTIAINGGEAGNVYGGGEAANIVVGADETGMTVVNMNGGTVHQSIYGGGLGNETNVATSTTVTANGGTVTEDVYGGSGFGKVGATFVIINNGATVTRDVFGGGFGSTSPNNYEADVNGNASVTVNKGAVISGNVYGGNNTNGSPKGTITVLVDGPADEAEKAATPLNLKDVFGGGKNAATTSSSNEIPAPKVTIKGCETVIARVFGGGDAASAPATDVEIWGGHIGNGFAGGNGEVVAAHVGYLADGTTPYTYGTGNTNITIKGGVIENVFGGSNTAGNIRGEVSVTVEKDDDACDMQITNLYGGGNEAPGKAGTISIVCTGEDGRIENVYGGANKADVTGDITLNINGGNIGNAFGGNNNSGTINGAITVNVNWDEGACGTNSLTNVYGGGNLASYTTPAEKQGPTVNLINGTVSNNVYGGGYGEDAVVTGNPIVNLIGTTVTGDIFGGGDAAPVTGDPLVNANYGSVKDIFAGGRGSTAVVTGDPKAYVNKTDDKELTVVDVYGGGDAANVVGTGNVQLDKGTVRNIYGGGNAADVTNTDVVINGGVAAMAFAGGHGDKTTEPQKEANVTGDAHLTIHGGSVTRAFAGSNSKGTITGSQLVTIVKDANALAELHVTEAYGGGNQADGKAGTIEIGCTGGNTEGVGDVYGGAREANITTDIALVIKGGNIDRVFGGNNVSGNIAGSIQVDINEDTETYGCGLSLNNVYGAGNQADYTGSPAVNILKGTVKENVFGGGLEATVTGDPTVTVDGGTVTVGVYGGGALADIKGATNVNITNGTVGNAYGGGLGQLASAAVGTEGDDDYVPAKEAIAAAVTGNANVTVSGGTTTNVFGCNNLNGGPNGDVTVTITSGIVTNVYGGGNQAAASVSPVVNINGGTSYKVYGGGYGASAVLTGNPTVNVTGGTISSDVYGGGALANVTGSTTININGGTVAQDVYGGGALADVSGNTTINLTGGSIRDSYGGGLGQLASAAVGTEGDPGYIPAKDNIAALVNGNTTTTLNGSVVNGSVFGANNINGTPKGHVKVHVLATTARDGQTSGQYDISAVYGGGNKAAYEPSQATYDAEMGFAEVLIENCDNSIEYVYGGGNAAPVPGTQVKIYGANAINHAFAGGNGAGVGNQGADVGYLEYTRDEAHKYGTGTASIAVYGGTVHNVYGGSNTLGYIRGTTVNVADGDGTCPLLVDNVFGGGNEAPMDCDITMTIDCSDGGKVLYAGANNADVNGNITLNIHSGTYEQVFCGNNQGGAVRGKLEINVDETGCTPIIIKELFGGGNLAPYSVYGYNGDGTCKTSGEQLYTDPTINVISCTAIGTVYGGGYGNTAVMYGNPIVNVDMVLGDGAKGAITRAFNVIKDGVFFTPSTSPVIPNAIGVIGNIFGGGKEAAVNGNTTVNVCVKDPGKDANISPFAEDSPIMGYSTADKTANDVPTGSIYGGGKLANVYGNTKVHIRNGSVEGNVFGAGQGDAAQPDAAAVSGKTKVIIGEE